MRIFLSALAVVAALNTPGSTAAAKTYPWCMVIQDMDDGWACGFETFEQCRSEARAGNTGFCAPNPAYQGPEKSVRPQKRRRVRG